MCHMIHCHRSIRGTLSRKYYRKELAMGTIITTLGGLVQDVWTEAANWAPVLAAAGFAVVGYAVSGLFRIIGARRRRGRR